MLLSTLQTDLSPLGITIQDASEANSLLKVIDDPATETSTTVADIESALSAVLPDSPISSVLENLPSELSSVASELTSALGIKEFDVGIGAASEDSYDVNGFNIVFDVTFKSPPTVGGISLDEVELQLNLMVVGGKLAWRVVLGAKCTFLKVDCVLEVDLGSPSISIAITAPSSGDIDTILGAAKSDQSLSSLTNDLGIDTNSNDGLELITFMASAELADSPDFSCALALTTNNWKWKGLDIDGLMVSFSYGGSFSISVDLELTVADIPLDTQFSYSSGTTTVSVSDTTQDIKVGTFVDDLATAFGFTTDLTALNDIDLTSVDMTVTDSAGKLTLDLDVDATLQFDGSGTSLSAEMKISWATDGSFTVELTLNTITFTMTSQGSGADTIYLFATSSSGQVSLVDLVELARLTPLYGLASDIDLTLKSAALVLKPSTGGAYKKLFALEFSFDGLSLPDNAIIEMITGGGTVSITDAKILAASEAWTVTEISAVSDLPMTISKPAAQGVNLEGTLEIGSISTPVPLEPPNTNTSTSAQPSPPQPVASSDAAKWFNVQKQIGPLYMQKIGLGFAHGDEGIAIEVLADASFTLGPFTIAVNGFDVEVPFEDPSDLSVGLKGLDLSYSAPPLAISGGFLEQSSDLFVGQLSVTSDILSLAALGEYGKTSGHTTLALFASLTDPPLGGPVFCVVTGLAAGGGYNSKLNVPTQASGVASFALVEAATGGVAVNDPFTVIESSVTPSLGDDWLALGLNFTSFELINSTVLLTASFGHDLQFAVLGQSEVSIPPDSTERLAYAQLDVLARFVPAEMLVSVEGVLSKNSFVLDPNCHIQGGFIYMLEGDGTFIVSYGGYAPAFDYKSRGYPAVPRLGLSWNIDSHISIVGDLYFALTPAAMMAGGGLKATWNCGIIAAWFDVSVNILIQWRPFYYEADFSMSLGVKFDLKIGFIHVHFSFHIGASLGISGPPFHGYAHIDLDIISFTITFGPQSSKPAALSWGDFRALLPGSADDDSTASALLSAKVTSGLRKTMSQSGSDTDWIVNGTKFAISLQSSVPVTNIATGDVTIKEAPADASIGILPMDESSATGTLTVTLTYVDGDNKVVTAGTEETSALVVAAVSQEMASAHWGTAAPASANAEPISCTAGYTLSAGRPEPDTTVPADLETLLETVVSITAISDRAASASPFG